MPKSSLPCRLNMHTALEYSPARHHIEGPRLVKVPDQLRVETFLNYLDLYPVTHPLEAGVVPRNVLSWLCVCRHSQTTFPAQSLSCFPDRMRQNIQYEDNLECTPPWNHTHDPVTHYHSDQQQEPIIRFLQLERPDGGNSLSDLLHGRFHRLACVILCFLGQDVKDKLGISQLLLQAVNCIVPLRQSFFEDIGTVVVINFFPKFNPLHLPDNNL